MHVCLPVDAGVDGLHRFGRPFCLRLRAVGDQVEGSERAPEPAPEVAAIVGVLDDTDGDERWATWRRTAGPPPKNGVSGVLPTLRITLSGEK